MTTGFFGDALAEEAMLAFGLGQAQSERQERIYKLIAGKSGLKRPKKGR